MASQLLEGWCKGMNIDPENCLLVQGVPAGFGEGSIESTLEEHLAGCVVLAQVVRSSISGSHLTPPSASRATEKPP
uniref:Paraneoplastic antigen Ma-like N-terminal domain-containing protein n=1 Tax=Pelusios castaneus TaxID=367368 RepID=A0A8C8SAG5_9SAUR